MKKLILLLLAIITISSCKKQKEPFVPLNSISEIPSAHKVINKDALGKIEKISVLQGYLITVVCWFLLPFVCSLPLYNNGGIKMNNYQKNIINEDGTEETLIITSQVL